MKRYCLLSFLTIALLTAGQAWSATSGHRAALLIGNAEYDGFTLAGVEASLDRVAAALQERRFAVERRENLREKELDEVVQKFARSVPTNGVAVVYYVGLGANVERFGKPYNLMRPVNASIDNEGDYRSKGYDVRDLVEIMHERSGARRCLIFLDACWESPIRPDDKKVHGGMVALEFEEPRDATVMFAAQSGKTMAPPDAEKPSKFAAALARHAAGFDDSIKAACDAVAEDVGGAWCGGAIAGGVGEPPALPVTNSLREGKTPGEGYVNSIGMTFRWCPAGSFTMGSTKSDTPATRDRAPVRVTLSRGFWIGEHEVTQLEYELLRGRNVPPGFTRAKNAPFWGVSEAKHVREICEKLTEIERKAGVLPKGWEYACPTEAQWEYACRAGSTTAYCFGDDPAQLGRYGNFADRALWQANPNYHWAHRQADDGVGEALAPVGSYRPNAWGIRDMHGNVAELVADHLLPDRPGGIDPLVVVEKNGDTQIRGGAWCSTPLYCESSFRNSLASRDKHNYVGFRIILQKVD